jgi:hypothetical protein
MRRWWSAILVLALAGILPLVTGSPASAAPAGAAAATPPQGPVVVVGVPDLRWQDLDPATTPTLWNLAGRSAVAALTDNSGSGVARRATGWVTFNTGSRAVAHVPSMVLPDPTDPEQLQTLREDNLSASYAAQVGALGDSLRAAGLSTAAVGGPGAVLGAMASDGTVGAMATSVTEGLAHADVVVVELPELYDANRFDHDAVQGALTVIDDSLSQVLQELPENASLLVVGMSDDAGGPARLHVAMASGPAFPPGLLTSASTGRTGVVQLIDVAPTILWLRAVDVPSSMLGVHWRSVPGARATTAEQVADFVDLDHRSVTVLDAVSKWYYPAMAWLVALFVAATLLVWRNRREGLLRPAGAFVASLPVASYLMQLVPWWRAGSWPMAPLTLAIAGVIGAVAAFAPWLRDGVWRTAGFVGGLTAAVVALDAATGSALSLDGPFADNPIIAGRFHGIGNVAFSLLGAGTLVVAAAVSTRLSPRRAGALVAVLGLLAVVVDGHPGLGDDFGGVLSLLPAVAVLALALSRVRVSWRHVSAVLAAAVVVTASFAAYDYSRPASERTHLGRFVAQVADGTAETVVVRKLHTSLNSFTWGFGRWIVVCWLVLAVAAYLGRRRGLLQLRADVDRRTAGGLLAALAVLAALGSALNDSGLEVTAFTFFVAAPLLVPLVQTAPQGARDALPEVDLGAAEVRST